MSDDQHVREALEAQIGDIVAKTLPRARFEPEDDLFDLGLTSLAFVRVIAELNARYGTNLNGSELGDIASVRSMTGAIALAISKTSTSTITV